MGLADESVVAFVKSEDEASELDHLTAFLVELRIKLWDEREICGMVVKYR